MKNEEILKKDKNISIILKSLFSLLIISIMIQGQPSTEIFITFVYILLIIIGFSSLVFFKEEILVDYYLVFYVGILFILLLISTFIYTGYYSTVNNLKGILYFIIFASIVTFFSSQFSRKNLYWIIINKFSLLAAFFIVVQSIAYYFGNVRLDEFSLVGEWLFNSFELNSKYRPASLFSEPSHLSEFLLLSVYFYIFKERNVISLIILIVAIVLSTSGIGIVGVALLSFIFLYSYKVKKNKYYIANILILNLSRMAILFFLLSTSTIVYSSMLTSNNWLIQRLASGGTFEARVLRSFDLYEQISFTNKILGTGLQNQANYLNFYSITSIYDNIDTLVGREYAQTIGYLLVTTGVIGLISFLLIWVSKLIVVSRDTKTLIILFLFLCLLSNMFTRGIIVLYMIIIYSEFFYEKKKKMSVKISFKR